MKYKRIGECDRTCGKCCSPTELVKEVMELPFKRSCKHLIKIGDICSCSIYKTRPDFCKKYPAEPADLIKGCGYSFVQKEINKLGAVGHALSVTA